LQWSSNLRRLRRPSCRRLRSNLRPPRRSWQRMLVLAVLIFVAGAVSGTLLGGRDSARIGVTLGGDAEALNTLSRAQARRRQSRRNGGWNDPAVEDLYSRSASTPERSA
jgi:hypothetical protein